MQIVLEQVPCRWSSDSEGAMAVRIELKPVERVDGSWWNEDAVVQQLERPVYTAQIDNPVPGNASTCTPSPQKLVDDLICHIEPIWLRVRQVCQAAVVLRAAHNSCCSIHDPLQLVSNRLWCSSQQHIAIVDHGRNEGVNQYGC